MPLVPGFITGMLGNYFAGAAGLVLFISAFFRGRKVAVFVVVAAVLFAGQWLLGGVF